MWLKLPIDKQAHFWAGAAIAASVTLYAGPLFGLAACVLAGAAKEVYDATGRGTPDVWDFVATVAGSVVILPILLGTY